MKLLLDRPLRIQAVYLTALVLLILTGQLLFLVWRFSQLDKTYHAMDFVRQAQLTAQHTMTLANQQVLGQDREVQLHALLTNHEYQLAVLAEGGRLNDTEIIVPALSGMAAITHKELVKHWSTYKKNLLSAIKNPDDRMAIARAEALGTGLSRWYDQLTADLAAEADGKKMALLVWLIVSVLIDLALLAFVYRIFTGKVLQPLKAIEDNTRQHANTANPPHNEIGQVALQVNEVLEQLRDASDFVQSIGEGNLDIDYRQLDHSYTEGKNRLADSLIGMQLKLRALNEEEQKRKWANEGFSKFVDILRTSENDIAVLGDKIISALVKYTHANQGGLYLLNDENPDNKFLELISLFAFDIKKHEQKVIKPGEGILGQTFLEKESTYLLEIPDEYIRIRSGLGDANPKAILVVPLKMDDQVYGVVELASFNEYQPHEITFVEKLGETIASTLASVKAAQRNRKLLNESKMAAEAMHAQEEEMRQNMEELQATQEEMARKERDYVSRIEQLEQQVKAGVTTADVEAVRKEKIELQQEYEARIRQLNEALQTKENRADDWAVAEEVERALRVNLEALRITGDELNRNG